MIKPKTKSPRKPRLRITNEITNKIQKLRAKDETSKQTKTQTHKRNKKHKEQQNSELLCNRERNRRQYSQMRGSELTTC